MKNRPDIRRTVGAWLRELRSRQELTQEEVAERSGVSAKYYSEVERGLRNITLLNLQKILDGMEVKTDDVLRLIITEDLTEDDHAIIELVIRIVSLGNKKTKRQVHTILEAIV